jgi:hypothetical protein
MASKIKAINAYMPRIDLGRRVEIRYKFTR